MSKWTKNDDGVKPVEDGVRIDVTYRDGSTELDMPSGVWTGDLGHTRNAIDWTIDGVDGDIVFWRLSGAKENV